RNFVGMDQGERNWEPFLLPVAVRDDDIGAPVLAAPVPGKSFKVDPRRANLLPKWVSIIIELPSKYAAIRNLEVKGIVFDIVLGVVGRGATALSSSLILSFFRSAGFNDALQDRTLSLETLHSIFERQLQVGFIQSEYAVRPSEQFARSPGLLCRYFLGAARKCVLFGLGVFIIAGENGRHASRAGCSR